MAAADGASLPRWVRAAFWAVVAVEWTVATCSLLLCFGLVIGVGAILGAQAGLSDQTRYAPGFRAEAFREVETGMIDEEVLQSLGPPLKVYECATVNGRTRWYSSPWMEGPSAIGNVERTTWAYSLPGRETDVYRVYSVVFGPDGRVSETVTYLHSD